MATNRVHRIAVIPGDGIGKEVVPEGVRVLEAAANKFGFELRLDDFDFASCDYYEKHGRMMPEDWKEQIGKHDAIFFGAVGMPDTRARPCLAVGLADPVPPRVRPVRQPAPGAADARRALAARGRKPGDIDFWVVRENTEGEYSAIGGRCSPAPTARSWCRRR